MVDEVRQKLTNSKPMVPGKLPSSKLQENSHDVPGKEEETT